MPDANDDRSTLLRAGSWLAHPVSVLALVVLIVNDHILKQAYGTWWTGKLSDAAGLVFFPALVALVFALAIPKLTWRALTLASLGITALGFTWVKATSMGAATASGLLSDLAGPSLVRQDATDLFTLPFLAIAAWVAVRPAKRGAWRAALVLPVAVLATTATSQDNTVYGVSTVQRWGDGVAIAETPLNPVREPNVVDWWLVDTAGGEFHPILAGDGFPEGSGSERACAPWDQSLCFRAYEDHLGVESSTDGGATWAIDWEVPDDTRAELLKSMVGAGNYNESGLRYLETLEVAIAGGPDSYYVYAANGMDGVAMRNPDGAWERIGAPSGGEWKEARALP